jgi:hypothetical protein
MKVIPFKGEHIPGAQFLQETEVTAERLRSILETAVIDLEPDDEGDLYLTSGVEFPLWVHVDSDRKLIELFTFIGEVTQPDADVALRLNQLNNGYVLGQFSLIDSAIHSRHVVSFDGGLLPRQFVKLVRRFASSFREAIGGAEDLLTGEGSADSAQRVE